MSYSRSVPKPKNAQDFEEMCKHIYSIVYNNKTPKHYGRNGQKQDGIDIVIQKDDIEDSENRIAIQCKHVQKLSFNDNSGDSVCKEIEKVEQGNLQINKMIIVTTLPSDKNLFNQVVKCSDLREREGKFPVSIEFWNEIETHVYTNNFLTERYISGSEFPNQILELSKKNYTKGKYEDALEPLVNQEGNNAFDYKERAKRSYLIAAIYLNMGQHEKSKQYIDEACNFNPVEKYLGLQIYITMMLNTEEGRNLLEIGIQNFPESIDISLNNFLLMSKTDGVLPSFATLNAEQQAHPLLISIYLFHYYTKENIKEFLRIYEILPDDKKEQERILYLQIVVMHGIQSEIEKALLFFKPREKKVWMIESPFLLDDIIKLIIQANLLIRQFDEAIQLLEELEDRGIPLDTFHVNLYFRIAQASENRVLYEKLIKKFIISNYPLTDESLLFIADISAFYRDVNSLKLIKEKILEPEHINFIRLYEWELDYKDKSDEVLRDIEQSDLIDSNNLKILIQIICFILLPNKCTNELLISELHEKIDLIVNSRELLFDEQEKLAFYYLRTNKSEQAHLWFHKSTTQKSSTILNCFISLCINNFLYREAHNQLMVLLTKHPNEQSFVDHAINLAISTGDFNWIDKIIKDKELIETKLTVGWWHLKAIVTKQLASDTEYKKFLRSIPEYIEGNINNKFGLSYIEIKEGYEERGLKRAYRTLRQNLHDHKAQELYHNMILMEAMGYIKFTRLSDLLTVTEGTKVIYKDQYGREEKMIIDLDEGFPPHDEFITPSNQLFLQFRGKSVGDKVRVPMPFGENFYTITQIQSIFLAMNHYVHQQIRKPHNERHSTITPMSVEISEKGITNLFDCIIQLQNKTKGGIESLFKMYRENLLTIPILASLINIKPYLLIYNWPLESSLDDLLHVCNYSEIKKFIDFNKAALYLVDSITLCELSFTQNLAILDHLPTPLLITQTSYEEIQLWLQNVTAEINQTSFTIGQDNDGFFKQNKNINFFISIKNELEVIISLIKEKCEILPAYGSINPNPLLLEVQSILTKQENATLRLAEEKSAIIFSSDARLRLIADGLSLYVLDPNDLLDHLHGKGKIKPNVYYRSLALQFCNNRTTVENLSYEPLGWYCAQGTKEFREVMTKLTHY